MPIDHIAAAAMEIEIETQWDQDAIICKYRSPASEPAEPIKRITEGVRDMLAIIEDPDATEQEKSAAASTIVEAVAPEIMEDAARDAKAAWDSEPAEPQRGVERPTEPGVWFRGGEAWLVFIGLDHVLRCDPVTKEGKPLGDSYPVTHVPTGNWLEQRSPRLVESIASLVAKIRNPREWPGMTTDVRKMIADELESALPQPPGAST